MSLITNIGKLTTCEIIESVAYLLVISTLLDYKTYFLE